MAELNCYNDCPFVQHGFRPCTEKVAHEESCCKENIANNFGEKVIVQPKKGDNGPNRTEVLRRGKVIATVRDGLITQVA